MGLAVVTGEVWLLVLEIPIRLLQKRFYGNSSYASPVLASFMKKSACYEEHQSTYRLTEPSSNVLEQFAQC